MTTAKGPWVGMTAAQAKTYILRAALAFKQREGRWPSHNDGADKLLGGCTWSAAGAHLARCETTLPALLGKQPQAARGPWCQLPVDKAKTWLKQAAKKFCLRTGRLPYVSDGACPELGGASWKGVAAFLTRVDTTLPRLLGKDSRDWEKTDYTYEQIESEALAFHNANDRWPLPMDGSQWKRYRSWLRNHGSSWAVLTGVSAEPRFDFSVEAIEREIAKYTADHGKPPTNASGRCSGFQNLTWMRAHQWCRNNGVSWADMTNSRARHVRPRLHQIREYFNQTGRWPCYLAQDEPEHTLGVWLKNLRVKRNNWQCLFEAEGVPWEAERKGYVHGKSAVGSTGELVSPVARLWLDGQRRPTTWRKAHCFGRTVSGIQDALYRGGCGLNLLPCYCQATSLARVCDEIEADCWLFSIEGKPKLRLNWTDLRARGLAPDPAVPAQRIAFLDWENPDAAVRRPWSPPATQPEAGKPAPAKGKGKRASAEG